MSTGKSIAITRPVGQGEETSRFVRRLGWNPFIVQAVELSPLEQSSILKEFSRGIAAGPVDSRDFITPTGRGRLFGSAPSPSSALPCGSGQLGVVSAAP